MGIGSGSGSWFVKDLPLFIAFAVLAAYTYSSGLRAPALIAFVKDILIYVVIIVAVIYLPHQLGGWDHIFGAAQRRRSTTSTADNADAIAAGAGVGKAHDPARRTRSGPTPRWRSARRWRCSCTRTRSPACCPREPLGDPAQRRAAAGVLLPARAARPARLRRRSPPGVKVGNPPTRSCGAAAVRERVPAAGSPASAFAAIAIGALVPAAIMSIAAANLLTRNIYRAFIKPDATPRRRRRQSKIVSLVVKFGALVVRARAVEVSSRSTCSCSAASGSCRPSRRSWSASTRAGSTAGRCWPAGRSAWSTAPGGVRRRVADPGSHFGGPLVRFPGTDTKVYIAAVAFVINVLVTVVLTVVLPGAEGRPGRRPDPAGRLHRRRRRRRGRGRGRPARPGPRLTLPPVGPCHRPLLPCNRPLLCRLTPLLHGVLCN